jgi:hypothetical protein
MNGHVFKCYEERGDRTQFPKLLEALNQYTAKNLKFLEDFQPLFAKTMTAPTIPNVADIPDTATKKQVFM